MNKTLLTVDANAKTVKGQEFGFMTGILYMAPSDISGRNVCSMAEIAGCKNACLYTAGRGAMNSVQAARIRKAKFFFSNRQQFMEILVKDIQALVRKAAKKGMIPLVRLNGTSDIKWENVRFDYGFGNEQITIFDLFPNVQFYDYTKIANRRDLPANYDLTFSYSGTLAFQKYVNQAIESGMRIAAVFRKRADIPAKFLGLQCVDGDNSDIRHIDPKGVIVALYAKGKAKKDNSGFVIDTLSRVIPLKLAA
jgi:hypothetical protein